MAEESKGDKEPSKEAADAFKALLGRIGEIFGVFDFSFFVSGAVCLGALVFGAYIFGGAEWLGQAQPAAWTALHVAAIILACYVLGIICFAAGRRIRREERFYADLPGHLRDFQLHDRYRRFLPAEDAGAAELTRRASLLYTRLWAEARQSSKLAPSFNLLVRYWVMAALCDGLSAALGVWWLLWVRWAWGGLPAPHPPGVIMGAVGVALVGAIVLCNGEARRYSKYQMYELVATLAQAHVDLDAPVALEPLRDESTAEAPGSSRGTAQRTTPPVT